MNLDYWRKAGAAAALAVTTVAATVWLMRPKPEAPAPPAAVPAAGPSVVPGALSSSFGKLAPPAAPAGVSGRWIGVMDIGSGPSAEFRFDLQDSNGTLTGTAAFPIGEGPISGSISGSHLTFTTQHRLPTGQFLTTSVSGELIDQQIDLKLTSEGAVSQLIVHRPAR